MMTQDFSHWSISIKRILFGEISLGLRCALQWMFRISSQKMVPLLLATYLQWKLGCFYKVQPARANWAIESSWTK